MTDENKTEEIKAKPQISADIFNAINNKTAVMLDVVESETKELDLPSISDDLDSGVSDSTVETTTEVHDILESVPTVPTTIQPSETSNSNENQPTAPEETESNVAFISPFDTVSDNTIPMGEITPTSYGGVDSFAELNKTREESPIVVPPETTSQQEQLGNNSIQPSIDTPPVVESIPPITPEIKGYTAPTPQPQQMENISLQGLTEISSEHQLFAKVLFGDTVRKEYRELLLQTFNSVNIFKNEFNILYALIHDKPNITITEDFIRLYLQANRAIYLNHSDVSLLNYKVGDNDEYAEFINSTADTFNQLRNTKVTEGEFHSALEMVKMKFQADGTITLLEEALKIVTEGMSWRGKKFQGYEGMKAWLQLGLNRIDNVVEQSDKKGVFVVDEEYMNTNEEGALEKICSFGIPTLDEKIGGVYEGDMVTFLAPEKGYKTRAAIRVTHTAIVEGVNSGLWALENGEKGVMAILRATHFDWFYNRNETNPAKRKIIDPDWIRKNIVPEELQALELISYQDLVTNPAYGKIIIFDEDFDAHTFVDILIEKGVKQNNMKFLLIDYLQLASPSRGLDKPRTVGLAYQKTLQFLKRYGVGGIFPAQVTQDTIDYIDKKGAENLASLELRDIGAESAETLRTPDVLLFMYGTMEDIAKCRIQFVGLPSRNAAPFAPVKTKVRPQACDFQPMPEDMW